MAATHDARSSSAPANGRIAVLAAIALILLVRVLRLRAFPLISADEGGWPLAVRVWLTQGWATFDYYMAPGYHWLLAGPYAAFGATHMVGRVTSVLVGLVGLAFAYGIGLQTFADKKAALWGVLLLGTSYQAVLIDRRALIEPFQVTLMLALTFFFLRRRRWDVWAVGACTAALLLTKISAIFMVPALAVAIVWRPPGERLGPTERRLLLALAAGVAITLVVFVALYFRDRETFMAGWVPNMKKLNPNASSSVRAGRFGLDPVTAFETIRRMGEYEPLMCGIGIAAMLKGWIERKHVALSAWLLFGVGFLLIQLYVQENHRVVTVAPMALLAAALLAELDRDASALKLGAIRVSWPALCVAAVVGFSVVRILGGLATARDPRMAAVQWLREHTDGETMVAAAPYILMQLEAKPHAFAWFEPPFLPSAEELRKRGVSWVAVDEQEWVHESEDNGASPEQVAQGFARCCELVTKTGGVSILRVRVE